MSSDNTRNSPRPPRDVLCESIINGIGFTVGASIVGALIAVVLIPAPGSAEAGAEIGRRIGGCLCGGTGTV